jgi:hypothetical protein
MKFMVFNKNLIAVISGLLLISCFQKEVTPTALFSYVKSSHSKIKFQNNIPVNVLTNKFTYEYVYNGAGVSVGDLNNDGLDDIYFLSNLEDNELYLNNGNFEFKEVSEIAHTKGARGWATGSNMVDINNDGLLDIYVCRSGPYGKEKLLVNELFVNQGVNKDGIPIFKESAKEYGLDATSNSIQAAFFDFDLDGDLDMYLMNHNAQTISSGARDKFSALGDKFYINENGKYFDKTKEVGIYSNAISYGLGLGVSDLNKDGWPDVYVSNDYDEPDYMYLNQKNGTFKEVIQKATNHVSNFSMGNDIADYDNDGYVDIINLDMVSEDNYGMKTSMASMNPEKFRANVEKGNHYQYMYNTFHKHSTYMSADGIPFFSDVAQMSGIANTDWSWAPLLADFDNDGFKDIFISNGIKRDFRNKDFYNESMLFQKNNPDALTNPNKLMSLLAKIPARAKQNYLYKNNGDLTFENTSNRWFPGNSETFSNGAVYADLDNDGDLDLIVNNVDAEASIIRNNSEAINNNGFLKFKFKGGKSNTMGLGAQVFVYTDVGAQFYENYNTRGYQSSVAPTLNIGLAEETIIDSVRVKWSNGKEQVIQEVITNTVLTLDIKDAKKTNTIQSKKLKTIFYKVKNLSELRHKENDYNDYEHQVLLPHKLSQFGPALAVGDINNDGLDDFYLGQSTGVTSQLYLQTKEGEFNLGQSFKNDRLFEDVASEFFDFDNDGDLDLYVASGGNEFSKNSENYLDRLYENVNGFFKRREKLLPIDLFVSSSKIVVEDFNNDGFQDVFVGGRHNPREYPSAVSSYLLINFKGKFKNATEELAPELKDIGMVTDAQFSDFDLDNDKDLIIVGEWMSPQIFKNTNGKFSKISNQYLESLSGWYYSIKSIDLDNDGDDDYVLGNLGNNYKYKANVKEPFEMYYADFDENGKKDIVLGYYNFGELFPVRGKECSTQQVPTIKDVTPTYHEFGSSTVLDLYGDKKINESLHLSSYNFSSGVLKNNGIEGFEFISFPNLAQISSVNDIITKDLNNDGYIDLLLAGNLFVSEIETPRNDAGYGLVVINKGNFNFEFINADRSGLFLPYDVKVLDWITISGKKHVLSGNNNELVSLFALEEK